MRRVFQSYGLSKNADGGKKWVHFTKTKVLDIELMYKSNVEIGCFLKNLFFFLGMSLSITIIFS